MVTLVTYHTDDDKYTKLADKWLDCAAKLPYKHSISSIGAYPTWKENACWKPAVLLATMASMPNEKLFVWIDVDAEFISIPRMFVNERFDMTIGAYNGWHFLGNLIMFKNVPDVKRVLLMWAQLHDYYPNVTDELLLCLAMNNVMCNFHMMIGYANTQDINTVKQLNLGERGNEPLLTQKHLSKEFKTVLSKRLWRKPFTVDTMIDPWYHSLIVKPKGDYPHGQGIR